MNENKRLKRENEAQVKQLKEKEDWTTYMRKITTRRAETAMNGLDGGKKTGELALPTTADVDSGLLLKPLNKFWENVALESFEQLPDELEIANLRRL